MTMMPITQKELDTRLKDAGGAKGLVEGVIAVLEHAISVYKRDRNSFDETLLEPLKLDLDVLITITTEMTDLMQSQSDHDQRVLANVLHAIGDCNAKTRALQQHIDEVNEKVARGNATAAYDNARLEELDDAINENNRKIAECREHMDRARTWWWVPGYNWYAIGTLLHDLCTNQQSRLSEERDAVNDERKSTEEHLEALRARVDMLTGEKRVMQCKIHALEESKKGFEQRSKAYAARIVVVADVKVYYDLLRLAIENMEENLDLPAKEIEKLNDSRELVLSTGEVRQDTLKGALIHLGEDYDRYKKDNGLVEGVNISFKLFEIHELLPREYLLATVQEVNRHPEELSKAMPGWEIANLVDGSVVGALYGGSTR
jgi:DNA repair exonuclease SbcCD ATPase subunit